MPGPVIVSEDVVGRIDIYALLFGLYVALVRVGLDPSAAAEIAAAVIER